MCNEASDSSHCLSNCVLQSTENALQVPQGCSVGQREVAEWESLFATAAAGIDLSYRHLIYI